MTRVRVRAPTTPQKNAGATGADTNAPTDANEDVSAPAKAGANAPTVSAHAPVTVGPAHRANTALRQARHVHDLSKANLTSQAPIPPKCTTATDPTTPGAVAIEDVDTTEAEDGTAAADADTAPSARPHHPHRLIECPHPPLRPHHRGTPPLQLPQRMGIPNPHCLPTA